MEQYIAIIPARGGSKGILKKNVIPIGGIPLVARSILVAKEVSYISSVYVSTDDSEIASIAQEYGASVIIRPAELATDVASSEDALLHAAGKVPAASYVFMQCTSPFTIANDLVKGIEAYSQPGTDSVLSVTEDHGGFLCGGFTWDENGNSLNYDYTKRPRRQDMKRRYRENGAFYIMSHDGLLQNQNRLMGNVGIVPITRLRSFEIDEPVDISLAEHHWKWLKDNGHIQW